MVVVNRVRPSVAGVRPREAVADALLRYSGVQKVWTVGWDPRACDAAALAGQALGERAPRSAARKGMQAVALAARAMTPARGTAATVSR
jgi:Flp pilus assembly CpaE family ATPase